ncbi:MAG: SMP-30/gluconolactonase/LRE family protein, partial [Ilumatobacteraceae bacterium]
MDIIGKGLKFPEGPVACADGSVLVVEMFGERITRITPDG